MSKKVKKKSSETPLMKQYNAIKAKHPEALLLFRVGDFYETFGQDAIYASQVLGIVLTHRKNGAASHIELAGFPHHSLDVYLPKLVQAGYRVAVCDQLEDPKKTKTIVKRGVTELVTPGVAYNENVLNHKQNNFLCTVHFDKKNIGISFLDISTGEFLMAEGNPNYIENLIQSFTPKEILYSKSKHKRFEETFGTEHYTFKIEDWAFTPDFTSELLNKHFKTQSLKGFGIQDMHLGIIAAGVALHYLSETQHDKIAHINKISRIEEDKYVWLDKFTIRNLELVYSNNPDGVSLFDVMDKTVSAMGGRMLKRWMLLPLKDLNPIQKRHEIVNYLFKNFSIQSDLNEILSQINDIERIISKVAIQKISPREIVQLKNSLAHLAPVKELAVSSDIKALQALGDRIHTCKNIIERIEKEIHIDAPVIIGKGQVINQGINEELDQLRDIQYSGKDYLIKIQEREIKETGIPSLKIAFNNVFGYYIEVRNTHKDKVPESWIRKQTLVNAERYITEELKEYEAKILGAEEKILKLEQQIFHQLVLDLADYINIIQQNANIIATLDCLLSFAKLALQNNYVCAEVNDSVIIDIEQGRHPVIESRLPADESYVANDVHLNSDTQQILMITGPNMVGKSALLRQTALITLMAQMGSFVPASNAKIGIVDKVFTRVGASDNISSGESTFMVEMNETASILNNVSDRSLILLDEIGRGTSTYDGISIAWSIAEFLHQHPKRPKTLFATHYHELNEMTEQFPRIKNFNVSIKELDNNIIFIRKLVEGGSEHSFGIHVAKMAGMPQIVVKRAEKILTELEKNRSQNNEDVKNATEQDMQLALFQLDDPNMNKIKEEIVGLDINTLTPVEALMKLNEIKNIIEE